METLSLPQEICVSFSGHLSTLFIRYSCCLTVVAQEDLQKRSRCQFPWKLYLIVSLLCLFKSHTSWVAPYKHWLKGYSHLHFYWKITDQISPRMHWGSGEGSSAETWNIFDSFVCGTRRLWNSNLGLYDLSAQYGSRIEWNSW